MGESRDKLIKAIKHYQDSVERHSKTKKSDKLLHAMDRLSALPIRLWHLEKTGIGRTVNGLKRFEGKVGESARNLVDKWKSVVKDEEDAQRAKQNKQEQEEIDGPGDDFKIAEQHEEVDDEDSEESPEVNEKKRRRSEEKSTERSPKKSKSSHHHHSKHKQRKKSESEDSDDSDSSDASPARSKSHKKKHSSASEASSSDSSSSSAKPDSDNSESSQSDSKHHKRKDSSKHSKYSKHKETEQHKSKSKSSSSSSKKSETDRKHKESSSSKHKDKSDKENVSKERSSSSKSASSDKHKHSNNDDKEKSRSSDKNRKSSSKEKPQKQAEKVPTKPKIRDTEQLANGIDSGSGASFADALGMLEAPVPLKAKKKKAAGDVKASTSRSLPNSPRKESARSYSVEPKKSTEVPSLLTSPEELEPLNINDLSSLLPSITPNYRPLGFPVDHPRKGWTDEEALSKVISAKHQRTKVYSGNKSVYTKVPTLFDICSRVLQDNLDALEYTGGVPYTILKHILEKANPNQLYQLEFHNPYLIEDTDELWQLHCQKEFRNEKREEMETWRDMYMRCLDERDARLKALTANIKQSQDKSIPVRQTKLAYVDSVVKPPRNVARKQAKNGTLVDIKRPSQTPTERLSQLAKAGEASKVSVPNPGRAAANRSSSSTSHSNLKPKKAPLMAKTLSLLKNRFGRR